MRTACLMILIGIAIGAGVIPCAGDEGASAEPTIRVAVLDFDSEKTGDRELGAKVATLVTAMLEPGDAYELVDREEIGSILKEAALGQSGIVGQETAARIGYLLGANILVTGRVFGIDDEMFLAAKVIGVETSRVFAEMVSFDGSEKVSAGAMELAAKVHETIAGKASVLIAKPKPPADPVEYVNRALGDMARPSVAVIVIEQHVGQAVIDPAVPTELKKILLASGFEVYEQDTPLLVDWARGYLGGSRSGPPAGRTKADVVFLGEAFSEFGTRVGDLVSCKARVELRAIDRKTGRLLAIDRKTTAHADLSEQIAGKTALQKATVEMAPRLITTATQSWSGSGLD